MPIALSTEQTFDVWLKIDAEMPPEKRPTFTYRYLTCRQTIRREELLKSETKDGKGLNAEAGQLLAIGLVGWRNLPVPSPQREPGSSEFTAAQLDPLDDILTAAEKWELVYEVGSKSRLSEEERKKSVSAQRSGAASSAPPADASAAA